MHYFSDFGMGGGFPYGASPFAAFAGLFTVVLVWSIFWKGLALWHSSRRGEAWWFVALLVINTAGILEILYLFGFAKLKFNELFQKGEKQG